MRWSNKDTKEKSVVMCMAGPPETNEILKTFLWLLLYPLHTYTPSLLNPPIDPLIISADYIH
jgi:hypothetical protein